MDPFYFLQFHFQLLPDGVDRDADIPIFFGSPQYPASDLQIDFGPEYWSVLVMFGRAGYLHERFHRLMPEAARSIVSGKYLREFIKRSYLFFDIFFDRARQIQMRAFDVDFHR